MGSVGGLDSRSLSVRILPEKYFHASDSRNSAVKNLITDIYGRSLLFNQTKGFQKG